MYMEWTSNLFKIYIFKRQIIETREIDLLQKGKELRNRRRRKTGERKRLKKELSCVIPMCQLLKMNVLIKYFKHTSKNENLVTEGKEKAHSSMNLSIN